jgi:hypothetical protein
MICTCRTNSNELAPLVHEYGTRLIPKKYRVCMSQHDPSLFVVVGRTIARPVCERLKEFAIWHDGISMDLHPSREMLSFYRGVGVSEESPTTNKSSKSSTQDPRKVKKLKNQPVKI